MNNFRWLHVCRVPCVQSALRQHFCKGWWLFAIVILGTAVAGRQGLAEPLVRLPGHIARAHPGLIPQVQGLVSGPVPLALALRPQDEIGLANFLHRVYDPHDPLYHHYLTPSEFTDRFGPTQSDYNAIIGFAKSQGLTVTRTYPNRLLLDVVGSATQVETAFHLHLLRIAAQGTQIVHVPDVDPAVPASIAARLLSVVGLDNSAVFHPNARLRATPSQSSGPLTGTGPNGSFAPTDIRTAYNLASVPETGSGQTLALVEYDGYVATDVAAFNQQFSLRNVPLQNVLIDGYSGGITYSLGQAEVTLDIEWQNAIVPGASKILVYEAPNSTLSGVHMLNQIATDDQAQVISQSWGLPELVNSSAIEQAEATALQQMAAQGQSYFASAGDSGAYDDGSTLSVDDPASQPYACAVGGTRLSVATDESWTGETTWNEGTGSGPGGGGISQVWPQPSYQAGAITSPSLGSTSMRNVPDVSLNADPYTGYAVYVQGGWAQYGGTSVATPIWSAFAALVNQRRAAHGSGSWGFPNPSLYQIGLGSGYQTCFHDINDGSTNLYYPAVTGYDLATGWGSFIGSSLINALAPALATTTTTTLTSSLNPSTLGQSVTLTATVSGAGGTPTGTVTFMDGATTLGTETLAGGTASYSTSGLASGNHILWASYGGDADFLASVSSDIVQRVNMDTLYGLPVVAWGDNNGGELGNNTTTNSPVPVQVVGPAGTGNMTGVVTIAGGGSDSLALKSDGTVWAWGENGHGELGNNTTSNSPVPVQVVGPGGTGNLSGVMSVAGGFLHSLALKSDGTVWTWGDNADGQLGNNTTSNSLVPVQVMGPAGTGNLTGAVAIAGGNNYSLALKTDGTVWAWGYNGDGQLGNNTTTQSNVPVQVVGPGGTGDLSGVVAIAGGDYHTLALKGDGTVWAWGSNGAGQLGNDTTTQGNVPVQVVGPGGTGDLSGVVTVAGGGLHSLALKSDGTVWAWGDNEYGELGNNTTTQSNVPVQVVGPGGTGNLSGVVAIACGALHSLALKSDGTVWAWGYNAYDQLGNDTTTNSLVPVQVVGPGGTGNLSGVVAIAGGRIHSLSLLSGLVSTTTLTSSQNPSTLGQSVTLTASVSGSGGTPTGTVTFMDGPTTLGIGTLTTGTATFTTTSLSVGAHNITAVYGGDSNYTGSTSTTVSQAVGLPPSTTTLTSSLNPSQLGQSVTLTATVTGDGGTPTGTVTFMDGAATLGTGTLTGGMASYSTSSLASGNHILWASYGGDATFAASFSANILQRVAMNTMSELPVVAWGYNYFGELGNNTMTDSSVPVQVVGPGGTGNLSGVAAIAGAGEHSLVLMNDGTVWAWGENTSGQLGNNTTTNSPVPVQVAGPGGTGNLIGVVSVAGGLVHSLGLKSDGTVWAWGSNTYGQLGNNTTTNSLVPVQVVGPAGTGNLIGMVAIAGGYGHSLALKSDGTVWAWGYNNNGQLGNNTTTNSLVPVQVMGPAGTGTLSGVVAIACGGFHNLALKNDGTVWAWGYNADGELGNNTFTNSPVPVQVTGSAGTGNLSGVVAIACGEVHSLALKNDGTVWAWGNNYAGRLGNNTTTNSRVPVQVVGPGGTGNLSGVTAIACGFSHSLALKSDGTVWDWGWNSNGQLGNNTTATSLVPVQVLGPGGTGNLSGVVAIAGGGNHSLSLLSGLASTTTLTSSLNPSTLGQSVTFTATVSGTGGTPTGMVTFMDGTTTLGTGMLTTGTATFTTTSLSVGAHNITAVYGGDTNYTVNTSTTVSQVVGQSASTTTLTSSLNPSDLGQSVTFTASVSGAGGTPTGSVTFMDGATTLGTGTLAAGTATFTTTSLTVATHSITAVYGGDANYTDSTSTAVSQVVSPPTPSLLTLSSTSISGGTPCTATVTLTGPAPAGGIVVTLTSSNPAAASVPATVTVPAGATTAAFYVTVRAVSTNTPVTITATANGTGQNASLTVNPPAVALSSLTLSPTSVTGGTTSIATVTLTGPAPAGGIVVTLMSSNTAAASVPASITVPASATTAAFYVTSKAVNTSTPVTVTATLNGTNQTASLTVNPPTPSLLTLSSTSISGGTPCTATVTLTGPAPAGGLVVTLTSSNPAAASVPATVTVPAGATTAAFYVTIKAVSTNTPVTITATANGTGQNASLTVNPPAVALSSLTLSPTSVTGGTTSIATVTLTGPAPAGGIVVTLMSSNTAAASVPASITVPASATTAAFYVTSKAVTTSTLVTISATLNGASQNATLTVNPPTIASLALSPISLTGGTPCTAKVTLTGPAPAGGVVVTLMSSNTAAASVPASITVPPSATTASFYVTSKAVNTSTPVTVTATLNGTDQTALLTVNPPTPSLLTLSSTSISGGTPCTATVTLTGPAPAGGLVVTLTSSNPAAASVPATVTVPAGATTAAFYVTIKAVSTNTPVTITATANGTGQNASLTVNPPAVALSSLTLSPTSVTGGTTSIATVTLTGPAPAGGIVVTLMSSNTAAASVPASITAAAGATTAAFYVTSKAVNTTTLVTISATLNGASQNATLTVNPPALSSLALSPISLTGGTPCTAKVTLTGPAPAGGMPITLSSSNTAAASVPASITAAAGATAATFSVTTNSVTTITPVTVTATLNGTNQTASLTVNPPTPSLLTLSSTSISGGSPCIATVTLTGPAPAGGLVVTLTSSNTAAASVPATVTVPAGATTAAFYVTIKAVSTNTPVTITATANGTGQNASLTVNPPAVALSSLTLSPTSVTGGTTAIATVTLTGPAPAGGIVVTLMSSNTAAASVPASITVPATATSASFYVTSKAVNTTTLVTISATLNGASQNASLTVNPVGSAVSAQTSVQEIQVQLALSDSGTNIQWNQVAGAVKYQILRSASVGGPYQVIGMVLAPAICYLDTTPQVNATNWYIVQAITIGELAISSQPMPCE